MVQPAIFPMVQKIVAINNLKIRFLKNSVSCTLPSGQLSNIPWRRSGVKYANNEAYFDVIEEVDAIIDKSGGTVSAEIQGYVRTIHFYRWYFK